MQDTSPAAPSLALSNLRITPVPSTTPTLKRKGPFEPYHTVLVTPADDSGTRQSHMLHRLLTVLAGSAVLLMQYHPR